MGDLGPIKKVFAAIALPIELAAVLDGPIDRLPSAAVSSPVTVSQGQFSGPILDVADGLATQRTGRNGATTVHEVSRLSAVVAKGDMVDIRYQGGVGVVDGLDLIQKDQAR